MQNEPSKIDMILDKLGELRDYVIERFNQVAYSIEKMEKKLEEDHDKLIETQKDVQQQQQEFHKHREDEKEYGRSFSNKVKEIEKKTEKLNFFYAKVIGIIVGVGIAIGLLLKITNLRTP